MSVLSLGLFGCSFRSGFVAAPVAVVVSVVILSSPMVQPSGCRSSVAVSVLHHRFGGGYGRFLAESFQFLHHTCCRFGHSGRFSAMAEPFPFRTIYAVVVMPRFGRSGLRCGSCRPVAVPLFPFPLTTPAVASAVPVFAARPAVRSPWRRSFRLDRGRHAACSNFRMLFLGRCSGGCRRVFWGVAPLLSPFRSLHRQPVAAADPCVGPPRRPFLPFYRAIRPDTEPVASASTSSAENWL